MRQWAGRSVRPSRATFVLAVLAAAPPLVAWLIAVAVAIPGLFNDFHSYWFAGRLLADGSSPYDLEALRDLAARQGDVIVIGTGYSYPLPFAVAMVPLSALPFDLAVVLFNGLSVAAFAAAVAAWLTRFHSTASRRSVRLAAFLCGACPPVIGSVLNGQANLVLVAAVAAGAALVLERSILRSAIGGVAIGLAAVVKLVPGILIVPLWLAGHRRAAAASLVAGFVAPLVLAAAVAPGASLDSVRLTALFQPDPFVTNQSLNGFVSRLVEGSDRMTSLAPAAFDPAPVTATITLGLAVATLAALWRARRHLATRDGLSLGLALGLVAATVGAPKTSFWNTVLVLISIGLLLASVAPGLRRSELDRMERRLLGAWVVLTVLQPLVWAIPRLPPGPAAALVVLLGSLALYGNIGLWALLGRRLIRAALAGEPSRSVRAPGAPLGGTSTAAP